MSLTMFVAKARYLVMRKIRFSGNGLARRLRRLVDFSRLTHQEISDLSGVSRAAPGAILRGEVSSPQVGTLEPIAALLGASLDWLVSGTGSPPTREQVIAAVERARAVQRGAA